MLSSHLLEMARACYDTPGSELPALAQKAARGGFSAGAEWMQQAQNILRPAKSESHNANFTFLGIAKYAAAAISAFIPLLWLTPGDAVFLLPLSAILFYLVESQFVFLFPVALDGSETPFRDAFRLRLAAGPTLHVLITVLHIAAYMLVGGFLGKGFLRSWAVGCLAVLIWHNEVVERASSEDLRDKKFELGIQHPMLMRREVISSEQGSSSVTLLYASDLHLNHFSADRILQQLHERIAESRPDVLLLGGDLSESKRLLPKLQSFISEVSKSIPVAAIPGNHDVFLGESLVRKAVRDAGGIWLNDHPLVIGEGAERICIVGPKTPPQYTNDRRVLCAHDPKIFSQVQSKGYTLVLAGHLHGSQVVLAQRGTRLYPGAFFWRWNGLRFDEKGSTLLVSRGVSDTIPIRWNCPREVLLCEL